MANPVVRVFRWLGWRVTALIVSLLLLGVILLQNTEPVKVDILFWSAVPMSKLAFALSCFSLGWLAGVLTMVWARSRSGRTDKPLPPDR